MLLHVVYACVDTFPNNSKVYFVNSILNKKKISSHIHHGISLFSNFQASMPD
jgi:hypothetical protein